MLTIYNRNSSLKKKFSVVVIWLVAIAMFYSLVNFLMHTDISLGLLFVPALVGFVVISAILLRCKIGRGFTLFGIYILMLFPFLSALISNTPIIDINRVLLLVVLGLLAIYAFSNEKAMDLFYIESNPKEHIFYALGAGILIVTYLKLF
jgi:uncharacterized membrane protein